MNLLLLPVLASSTEEGNPELRRLFSVASTLHQNFYENWLSGDVVKDYAEDVKQLIGELRKLVR